MRRRTLLLYLGAWTAVAVLTSAHTLLSYMTDGPLSARAVHAVAVTGFSYWFAWAVCGVAVVLAARRFPVLEQERWWKNLTIHAALALILTGVVLLVYRAVRSWAGFPMQVDFAGDYFFRLSTGIPTYAIVVGVVSAVEFRRRADRANAEAAKLSAHLARARLEALQARIRPHFLYNTINSIQSLVTEDPLRAEDLLGELGTVLRWVTDAPDAAEVPFAQEMRVVEAYLRIQAGRFEERLRVLIDVEPEVNTALVPPLILQPLVENAVEHGVARRRKGGRIEIIARRDGERLRIRVEDDGPGLDDATSSQRGGVGLLTTRSRLEAQYEKEASIDIENRAGGGVVATLVLPFRVAPKEAE